MRGPRFWALRGVKPRLTSSLNRSCCGGSITSIIWRLAARPISSGSGIITPRAYELNSFGWRLIIRTSSYLVIAQKPGPSGSGCQYTGAFSRSQRYCSHGWPWANEAVLTRSISMPADRTGVRCR